MTVINLRTLGVGNRYGPCSWLNQEIFPGTEVACRADGGSVAETGDPWDPYYLTRLTASGSGRIGVPARLAGGWRPATTQRSYALALLRLFR
jgi:hypothetical protein